MGCYELEIQQLSNLSFTGEEPRIKSNPVRCCNFRDTIIKENNVLCGQIQYPQNLSKEPFVCLAIADLSRRKYAIKLIRKHHLSNILSSIFFLLSRNIAAEATAAKLTNRFKQRFVSYVLCAKPEFEQFIRCSAPLPKFWILIDIFFEIPLTCDEVYPFRLKESCKWLRV